MQQLTFIFALQSLSTIIDLIIIQRWNIKFGINDKLFFFLGNAVFESLVQIMLGLPMSAIFAKVRLNCQSFKFKWNKFWEFINDILYLTDLQVSPPGMESAVFAYIVGIQNFSNMLR